MKGEDLLGKLGFALGFLILGSMIGTQLADDCPECVQDNVCRADTCSDCICEVQEFPEPIDCTEELRFMIEHIEDMREVLE